MIKKIVDASASWCGPCRVFANTFKKVSEMEKYKGIEFKSIDIEEDEGELYVEKYNIRSVPTILLLDENDNIIYKLSGNISLDDFVDMINNAMKQK
jgi:thiol-disulfide isomerase/thioredoxin